MASTDAMPVPRKNVAFRCVFPILDADGDLVTGAAGLDSEISKDQGTFADCTNEATEIATSSGVYYLDLTSTEMNADCVAIIVKTSTSGAKTTVLVFYPEEAGDYRADVTHFGGTAGTFSGGRPEVNTTLIEGVDATNQIRDSVVDDATRIDASALNTLSSHDPGEAIMGATDLGTGAGLTSLASAADLATVAGYLDTEVAAILAAVDTEVATIVTQTGAAAIRTAVGLASANLDTQLSGLDGKLDTIDNFVDTEMAAVLAAVDTEVAAIKAKTDSLTFTVAGQVDANVQRINDVTITGDGQPGTEFGV